MVYNIVQLKNEMKVSEIKSNTHHTIVKGFLY
jgi:hypothetical protein